MTQRLVIGSTAAQTHIPAWREPKDLDVVSPSPAPGEDAIWYPEFSDWITPGTDRVATLDELYTIKVSHSYWELPNGSWNKHMNDIVAMQNAGATLDMDLHKLLYSCWEQSLGKKKMSLNQDASDFFADAVPRIYDHDSIHYSVAYGEIPLYETVMKDGQNVMMDMGKVWALPYDQQIALFREEIYATALERWVIPQNYLYSPRRAYALALKKTITSLTKGRSARFIVLNYETFRDPDMDYVAHHKSKIDKLIPLEK